MRGGSEPCPQINNKRRSTWADFGLTLKHSNSTGNFFDAYTLAYLTVIKVMKKKVK
jgi:hypothetical protein